MMNIHRLKETLKRHEGDKRKGDRHLLYRCSAGKLTIGWGYNIEDNGISDQVADLLLDESIDVAIADAKKLFKNFDQLCEIRKEVIVNMSFNLGYGRLRHFKNMIGAVAAEDFVAAAMEMKNSKWYDQVGIRAFELMTQMKEGEAWQD